MKVLKFQAHGLWGPRQESLEACAGRLHRYFEALCASTPRFRRWFGGARSKRKALDRATDVHSIETLTKLLQSGRNRTDIGRKVIEDLGFGVGLWNGATKYEDEAAVSVHCGAYCKVPGLPWPNSVSIGFPVVLSELGDWQRSAAILEFTAKLWEPDFVTVFSNQAQSSRPFAYPFVDWMFYLPDRKYDLPNSIPAAHVERLDDLGTIIVVQEEPPDPANPEHTRNIERVRDALGL
ncbi:MAG: Imm52 family immunity protein [Planctomycetia bacterium]|nr:Imm52 family immunity protein [Planctomycetia bacterium]